MRIIHFIATMAGGGAERQLSVLSQGLVQQGMEVHIAFLLHGVNSDRLQASGANLHQMPSRGNHVPLIFWQVWQHIKKIKPDIIQTWLQAMDILAGSAARLQGIPWVISEQNSAEEYPADSKHWIRQLLAKGSDAIIANSKGGIKYWKESLGNNDKIKKFVIRNALPIQEINSSEIIEREKYQLANAQKIIMFAGRFNQQKNINNMVLALSELLKNPSIGAILCGEGELRPKIECWVRRNKLEDRVKLPGYLPELELWGLMKNVDVFLSASLFEGQPNIVLEAMACGCPLVVSDIPAHREFLNEQSAVLVDHLDPPAIAEGLRKVLEDPEAAKTRARIAQEKVSGWTISAIASQYEEAYQRILAR